MRLVSILLLVAACEVDACAEDWPQFRGPNRDGVSKETGLPLEWSASKNIVWKTPLPGPGSSSPIVVGNRVYVTCYSGYGMERATPPEIKLGPPGDLAELRRHLVCIDKSSGEILWAREHRDPNASDAPYKDGNIALHGYASHTPCADENGVYAYLGAAGAVGYSHDGKPKWSVRLGDNAKQHSYGSAASPLLYKNLFIVNGYIETAEAYRQGDTVALDTKSGREVWRENVGGEWSSPQLAAVGDDVELVASMFRGPWAGLDPATGKRLWQCEGKVSCSTPVVHGGMVYVMTNAGSFAIRAGGRGDETTTPKRWEAAAGPRISSPVFHDGHLYYSNDGHLCTCIDAHTGKTVYKERLGSGGDCYASPIVADGRIYYVGRDRGTFVLAAKPEYELLAHNKIEADGSVFNGSPAVSDGRLYLRSDKHLYCIGTKESAKRTAGRKERSSGNAGKE
jgi:outer membrane protein assembly factor BamB